MHVFVAYRTLSSDVAVLDKMLETFERNGLGLPKEEREKLKAIKKST